MKRSRKLTALVFLFLMLIAIVIWLSPFRNKIPIPKANSFSVNEYHAACNRIQKKVDSTKEMKKRGAYLQTLVTDTFFHYWEGTPWDFNGTTQCPGKGNIACGYFVTTVLNDAGFDLQRVKLAQMGSEQMITELVDGKNIHRYSRTPIKKFLNQVKTKGDQLYIVGLDSHVGFLSCEKGDCWFIHSSGSAPWCVVKEKAEDCDVLIKSRYRVTGCISADEKFLGAW
jgi:hypothetical protein